MIDFDELFKNHQASRTDCGPLSIITYKKPDSFENGLRYIFDNELSTLAITGDWLRAVAVNVNNMGSPDRLYDSAYEPNFGKYRYGDYELEFDVGYLNSKIVTTDERYSYDGSDFDNVQKHILFVLGLEEVNRYEWDVIEADIIDALTQTIVDMYNDRVYVCEESFENYVTDEEMSETEDLLEKYDVSLEQLLHVAPPTNDALVVAFEGFKRAYEELLEKEN